MVSRFQRALSAERIARLVESSDEGLGRITRLVEDTLDISRIQLGKLTLHRAPAHPAFRR